MRWENEPTKRSSWYWFRIAGSTIGAIWYIDNHGVCHCAIGGAVLPLPLMTDGEWYGPLIMPSDAGSLPTSTQEPQRDIRKDGNVRSPSKREYEAALQRLGRIDDMGGSERVADTYRVVIDYLDDLKLVVRYCLAQRSKKPKRAK